MEIRLKKGESILWQCRTDNRGNAECWADLWDAGINTDDISYEVLLEGQMLLTGTAAPYSQGVNVVNLNRSPTTRDDVDVMFVVDATGSMGDELEFLKVELNDVLEKVEAENMALTMRYGAVFYRDQDDAYLTRAHGFNEDVGQLIDFIRDQMPVAKRVGVLSTTGTYRSGIYAKALDLAGHKVIKPSLEMQEELIHPAIYDPDFGIKTFSSPIKTRARENLSKGFAYLKEGGAELVILGCTEIPLAFPEALIMGMRVVDPTWILARALVRDLKPEKLKLYV